MLPVPDFNQFLTNTSKTSSQTINATNKTKQSINQISRISNNSPQMNEETKKGQGRYIFFLLSVNI